MILCCVECGEVTEDGAGWRAFLDDDNNVVTYCGVCAHREFDEDVLPSATDS